MYVAVQTNTKIGAHGNKSSTKKIANKQENKLKKKSQKPMPGAQDRETR
jgi:hypothetical protein